MSAQGTREIQEIEEMHEVEGCRRTFEPCEGNAGIKGQDHEGYWNREGESEALVT